MRKLRAKLSNWWNWIMDNMTVLTMPPIAMVVVLTLWLIIEGEITEAIQALIALASYFLVLSLQVRKKERP